MKVVDSFEVLFSYKYYKKLKKMIGRGGMRIVSANEKYQSEGFTAAVELEANDIKNLKEVLKNGSGDKTKEALTKIVNFAVAEGHRMPIVQDEDGEDVLLLEIEDGQWLTSSEIPDIRNTLGCILLDHVPT